MKANEALLDGFIDLQLEKIHENYDKHKCKFETPKENKLSENKNKFYFKLINKLSEEDKDLLRSIDEAGMNAGEESCHSFYKEGFKQGIRFAEEMRSL